MGHWARQFPSKIKRDEFRHVWQYVDEKLVHVLQRPSHPQYVLLTLYLFDGQLDTQVAPSLT